MRVVYKSHSTAAPPATIVQNVLEVDARYATEATAREVFAYGPTNKNRLEQFRDGNSVVCGFINGMVGDIDGLVLEGALDVLEFPRQDFVGREIEAV
jgi:hypothetical protein